MNLVRRATHDYMLFDVTYRLDYSCCISFVIELN